MKLVYLLFEEYNDLDGNIEDEKKFQHVEWDASRLLDKYTFNRLKNDYIISENVKRTIFSIMEMLEKKNIMQDPANNSVNSFSNDGVSVSYNQENVSQFLAEFDNRIYDIIKTNLTGCTNQNGAPLLYRGYSQADFLPPPEKQPEVNPDIPTEPIEPDTPEIPPTTEIE